MREISKLGGEGILTLADIEAFKGAKQRVALLMSDGRWHHAEEIDDAAGENGVPAREGLRRMREVRAELEPRGFEFERERVVGRRAWRYRMTRRPEDRLF